MFTRLARKAEQCEKYECACDKQPAKHLEVDSRQGVIPPIESCDLFDLGKVAVCVSPALPRYDTRLRIGHDEICPQRNGRKHFSGGNGHQAKVLATIVTGH